MLAFDYPSRADKPLKHLVFLFIQQALSIVKPVDAASLTCGPGNDWVNTCPSSFDQFLTNITINADILGFGSPLDFTTTLSGKSTVFRGEPVDAVIDDPLLGNVGVMDGRLDVIKTELFDLTVIGLTLFVSAVTAIAGDGVPDLKPTPSSSILPYESLYSAGAIIERPDNPALADSFLNIFLEIQGTVEGSLRNKIPLNLRGTMPLSEFPPSRVDYVSTDVTSLFIAGPDGIFWTGDESEFARLVPDNSGRAVVLTSTPVPEPSTGLSSVFVGLAISFGF